MSFYLFMRLSVRTGHLYNLSRIFLLRRFEFVENKGIVEGVQFGRLFDKIR